MRGTTYWDDEHGSTEADLRYEPELSTRDVAELLSVKPATVRQWVARGHLQPSSTHGTSYVFDRYDVLEAHGRIVARHKASGAPGRVQDARMLQRIRQVHPDALLTIAEAARLVEVAPATVRSWIHRGYLQQATSSRKRAVLVRLDDVVGAALTRTVPRERPRRR